jgi:hypothetical protein
MAITLEVILKVLLLVVGLLTQGLYAQEKEAVAVKKDGENVEVLVATDKTPQEMSNKDEEKLEKKIDKELKEGNRIKKKKGIGATIDTQVNYAPDWKMGTVEDDYSHKLQAKLLVNVIDNKTDKVLYTIPVNANISKIVDNGTEIENLVNFDLNVRKVFSNHLMGSFEVVGSKNSFSEIRQNYAASLGVNYDLLGNTKNADKPHLITSLYYMRGKDYLADGSNLGKNWGSVRLELNNIIIKDKVRIHGKANLKGNLSDFEDYNFNSEVGVGLVGVKVLGSTLAITPIYRFNKFSLGSEKPGEHLHSFNLAVSLNVAQIKFGRTTRKKKRN